MVQPSVPLICRDILTFSVVYYSTDPQQNELYVYMCFLSDKIALLFHPLTPGSD